MAERRLEGKVALVTGAASGIGRAAARTFADEGSHVAMVDKNGDGLSETAKMIKESGGSSESFQFDLMNWQGISGLVASILGKPGHIDILLNIAGISEGVDFLEVDGQLWDDIMTVDLRAPFILMQEVGKHMIARGGSGKMVNVSSSSALRASSIAVVYSTAKAGLIQLTRIASQKFGPHDINVNVILPGFTDTPMMEFAPKEWISEGPLANPFKRISTPEEVAKIILFLCLPESRQITGHQVNTSAGSLV